MIKEMAAYGGQGLYRVKGTLSPLGWATGPCRPLGATCPFFSQGSRCEFEEKKLHLAPVALWGATGGIFEIFQNGHIFLNFFKKNIKKKSASVCLLLRLPISNLLAQPINRLITSSSSMAWYLFFTLLSAYLAKFYCIGNYFILKCCILFMNNWIINTNMSINY